MGPARRSALGGTPLDGGRANGGWVWFISLETTVARTMISPTGTSQLPGLPPAQEQAWAGRVDSENAAAIKPIRNRIAIIKFTISRFSLRYYARMAVVPYRGNVQGRSPAIGRRDAEGFTHLAPIPKHMPTYEELLSIAMCVNGGSVRRVLNFLSCDHRPTGINSERRSGVRNRKNYGVQKN